MNISDKFFSGDMSQSVEHAM